jgi:hypothetical protein
MSARAALARRFKGPGLSTPICQVLPSDFRNHDVDRVRHLCNGDPEPVAPSIARHGDYVFSPLHKHASSGMIHIEASRNQRFTLGMLFTEWGVRLTTDCVGGYCRPGTPVSAYVNGDRTSEPMRDIVFRKGEEIALVIGSPPSTIPSTWDCRAKISPIENPDDCKQFGQ